MIQPSLQGFKADLFRALAHPTRIRILELLRSAELTVSELQAHLGIESSSVSQQLGVLRARHIVEGRKEGTAVFYHVREPQVFVLLDVAREIFAHQLGELQALVANDGSDTASTVDTTSRRTESSSR